MKNLDLNKYGVQEMNAVEMRETDGGFWLELLFVAAVFVIGLLTDAHPERTEVWIDGEQVQ